MYKKYTILLLLLSYIPLMHSQMACRQLHSASYHAARGKFLRQFENIPRLKSGTECDKKIVRLNIYYMQDDNGQKNFSATGDGLGNRYNGKDFAYEMINQVNQRYSINKQLKIPRFNTIAVNHKDIQFVIEGIYYIRNSSLNREFDTVTDVGGGWQQREPSTAALLAARQAPLDSVVHIFVHGVGLRPQEISLGNWVFHNTYGGKGWGGDMIKVGTYARYWALKNKNTIPNWDKNDTIGWVWGAEGDLWEHELGHALSLDHTVLYGTGTPCPTMKFGSSVDTLCDDGIPDNETPSAWYMTDVLNGPIHPGERNDSLKKAHSAWWSNNTMDYNIEHALSPKQINRMHNYLSTSDTFIFNGDTILGKANRWSVETEQKTDKNFCNWIGDRIAHYGRSVNLNRNCSSNIQVLANKNRKVIASQNTEIFGGFEVMTNVEFEIINTCHKP